MGDRAIFVDDSNETRLSGELAFPESTPTDVLTVQADGSIAASPGGSIPAGTSYLIADSADDTGRASSGSALAPVLTVRTSAGADLALNADTTSIDILTTGWYTLSFEYAAQADVAVMTETDIRADVVGRNLFVINGPTPNAEGIVQTPPTSLAAGKQIAILIGGTTSDAGTWSFYGIPYAVQIFRVA